jgi:DNA-binding beta-propeller fold protein YncE
LTVALGALAAGAIHAAGPAQLPSYTLFESGQVRPLAISPTRNLLFAVNTPDNRLEIFTRGSGGTLTHAGSVVVGLEPVAVTARTDNEVWVVNHLSDSVSIVDVTSPSTAHVVRTLLVGDEPSDVVFGGPSQNRAFVTAAHRGQNVPFDPHFTTPGIGRADVWVFDATNLGTSLGGTPITIVNLFGDTPRALAVTPDGSRVYAAVFNSGNRTMTLSEGRVPDGGVTQGGLPPPNTNFQLVPQPETGLIVQYNGTHWVDTLNRVWDTNVRFSLPDRDVFAIDATASPPVAVGGSAGTYTGVGTTLNNMVVNPVNGNVYVTNTNALNNNRLEGADNFAGIPTLRGHFSDQRITVLSGSQVSPRQLNKHINYSSCCAPSPNPESIKSLALPLGMAITSDGKTLYVAAFGSSKIGVFDTAQLENDTFVPSTANQIAVSGGGPSGMVLDEAAGVLYALTRFNNSISIVDPVARRELSKVALYNPEPADIVNGRPFLYDAQFSSSHGDSACASCHVFGDFDGLAWDLGDPDQPVVNNPNPMVNNKTPIITTVHPLKGPMETQSLRGLANDGPMHWRGDRTGATSAVSAQPDSGAFDEVAAFKQFSAAYTALLGRSAEPSDAQMQAFSNFVLKITYPPNPVRSLDNSLTSDQAAGKATFMDTSSTGCATCHILDPTGNAQFGVAAPGFFGTDGLSSPSSTPQTMKVPHLRNMYQKVGMFGFAPISRNYQSTSSYGFMGDQIRGFGFGHDGSLDTLFRFLADTSFNQSPTNPNGIPVGAPGDQTRRQLESFMLAFDSNLAPIVGQQITLGPGSAATVGTRIGLLESRADVGECDLVAKGVSVGRERGYLYNNAGGWRQDVAAAPVLPDATLRSLASQPSGHELTFTCVPPGSGQRVALDRDMDGYLDGDEIRAGTNPADPRSHP